jgi:hypothetical protein
MKLTHRIVHSECEVLSVVQYKDKPPWMYETECDHCRVISTPQLQHLFQYHSILVPQAAIHSKIMKPQNSFLF